MNATAVTSVLAAALVGSVHCTSMCGGLVAFSTGGPASTPRQRVLALAAYNGVRGLGYVALGLFAGAIGSTLDRVGLRVGIGRLAGAVAGISMIAWGLVQLAQAAGARLGGLRGGSAIDVPVSRLVRRLRNESPVVRSAVIGGCTAALPCGLLHAFLVLAAGTGSAVSGGLVMATFWLGTVPAVAGIGVAVTALAGPLRRHAQLVSALVLVAFGLTSLLGRWSPRLPLRPGDQAEPASVKEPLAR